MINKHITFFANKFNKNIKCIDLTFGFGGYNFIYNIYNLISIDKNLSSILISRKIFKKNFFIFNIKIKNFFFILKKFNFKKSNLLIYDQGFNSCEIKNFFYYFKKKKYNFEKNKINNNLYFIFYKIILYLEKKFFIALSVFNFYDYYKTILFIKKIKIFKFKIFKLNLFEKSLNNGIKNSIFIILYV
ncbi:hypothetical protein CUN91_00775 [Candidatus Carsonella ruddii]|uniref:Uncharacterized protein n=1 Tax=Carsonella ruddii TaxID=114186 RepID=A0A2K8K4F4_CARRU|nr:hypothetical protein [Candidatus Carsonella ruddii]ATX33485.1 hypothetical protein CUN91_00775 [Candidatus Carsonella ruddii]